MRYVIRCNELAQNATGFLHAATSSEEFMHALDALMDIRVCVQRYIAFGMIRETEVSALHENIRS